MLAKQYKSKFLKQDSNKDSKLLDTIIEKENEYNVSCLYWSPEQIEKFLGDLHYESPNSLSRAFSFLRDFVQYICNEEKLDCPEYKLEYGKLYDLVDYDKILETTLTFEQYRHIKNQLDLNVRDKLIFELAWLCLTNEQIKKLKVSDIEFKESPDTGMELALLKVGENQVVRVEDPEVVQDIKDCMRENIYRSVSSDGKNKNYRFKDSEYLIKPVLVGRTRKSQNGDDDYIENPSLALESALKEVTCPGIDVTKLNINNIRRSKLIFLLAPQNEKYFDKDLIMTMLDLGNVESNLFWLKKVARMKYNNIGV